MPRLQRLDSYGRPIAPLTDARQESLAESTTNQRQRQRLYALLEAALLPLLHRGCDAEVTLQCTISNGMMRGDMPVTVRHRNQDTKEE